MSRTEAFVRRPDLAGGDLTPEEKIRMDDHARLWIRRAFRTAPIDRSRITSAILELYAVAGLKAPRVVIVPSPLVMAMAGGFASAILYRQATEQATDQATWQATEQATDQATWQATEQATDQATRQATLQATWQAARQATLQATWQATGQAAWQATLQATEQAAWQATLQATGQATLQATWQATRQATDQATDQATRQATRQATLQATLQAQFYDLAVAIGGSSEMAKFMFACANNWSVAYQGGNMWAGYDCYLSATRDILGLQLPQHAAYAPWEQAAIEGGFRWMHSEFCMVCDFPETLIVDEQNRPHCADGPSHRWRDGWSLYHWHGVRVPDYIIEHPEQITVALIEKEPNAEIRRAMVERYGSARYLLDSGAKVIARDHVGILYRKDVPNDEPIVMVRVLNSTPEPDGVMTREEAIATFGDAAKAAVDAPADSKWKEYMLRVPATIKTAHAAVAWTFGLTAEDYHPALET